MKHFVFYRILWRSKAVTVLAVKQLLCNKKKLKKNIRKHFPVYSPTMYVYTVDSQLFPWFFSRRQIHISRWVRLIVRVGGWWSGHGGGPARATPCPCPYVLPPCALRGVDYCACADGFGWRSVENSQVFFKSYHINLLFDFSNEGNSLCSLCLFWFLRNNTIFFCVYLSSVVQR